MSDSDTVHHWNGTSYRTILNAAAAGGVMSVTCGEAGPFNGPPAHVHGGEDGIFVILDGEITCEVAGRRLTRGQPGTAFVPRGQPHSFVTGPNGARCITVLTPGGFEGFFADMAKGQFQMLQDMAAVAAIAARYGSHFAGPGPAQREVGHA